MRIRFRFRPIPFVATVLLVALGSSLGQWQERRAEQKLALQASMAERAAAPPVALGAAPAAATAEALEFRHVTATGQFVATWPVFLDNRPQQGHAGFYLLMPFKIAGADTHVLVARGWLPRNTAEHGRLPPFATPAGTVTIHGVARSTLGHVMQLGRSAPLRPNAIVQNLEASEFARASGLPLLPFLVQQTGPGGDSLVRDWPSPALGVEKHQGYAFQWYALALMAVLFFVITGFRSGTKQDN